MASAATKILKYITLAVALTGVFISTAVADQLNERVSFNITAQPLESALLELSKQSACQIVFAASTLPNHTTPAVSGNMQIRDALRRLLTGTELEFKLVGKRTITVGPGNLVVPAKSQSTSEVLQDPGRSAFRLAQAEQAANAADLSEPQKMTEVQEVVVTATKRAENILSVPASITAVGAAEIADRGLVGAHDYLRTIPSVAYVDQGPGQNIVVIRGSYSDAFNSGPTVGSYWGEIPLTGLALGASADVKLIDVERLEVLRGPQGTLYGSNSLSGTIRNIPTAPKLRQFEARIGAGFSSTEEYGGANPSIEGVINLPLAEDRLALRGVFYHFENDGFIRNIAGDSAALQASAAFFGASEQARNRNHVGGTTTTGGRISALWKPTDNLDVTLMYLRQDDAADDRPFAQRGLGNYERADYSYGPFVGGGDALQIELEIANLTLEYQLPWGSLLSSTSLIHQDFRRLWQIGIFYPVNGFAPPIPQDSVTRARNVTEELRFTSSFKGPWQVMGGLFYEDTQQPTSQVAYYTGDPSRHPFTSGVGTPIGTPRAPGAIYGADIDRGTEQIAVFGEVSYEITPELKVTGGVRHFDYDYTFASAVDAFTTNRALANLGSAFVSTEGEAGETYKASVGYTPRPQALFYATFSQGFRLGRPKNVTQIQTTCDRDQDGLIDGTQLSSTDPLIGSDRLNSYEVGTKASAFGGRASVSASVYRNAWKDIPVSFRSAGCPASSTFNVGEVTVKGAELEGRAAVAGFAIDLGAGYVDSRLAETSPFGAKGARMSYAPRWNGHLGAEYAFEVVGRSAHVRGDWSYYGEYWSGLGQTGTRFPGYDLVDLSAGMSLDRLDVRLFANNVAGKYAVTSDISWPPNGVFPVRPRTFGIRLDARF